MKFTDKELGIIRSIEMDRKNNSNKLSAAEWLATSELSQERLAYHFGTSQKFISDLIGKLGVKRNLKVKRDIFDSVAKPALVASVRLVKREKFRAELMEKAGGGDGLAEIAKIGLEALFGIRLVKHFGQDI